MSSKDSTDVTSVFVFAPAKINPTLSVLARRPDEDVAYDFETRPRLTLER